MNREELIKDLYKNLYEEEQDNNEESIEDMEESILTYYQAAGFDFKSIDDVIKEVEKERDLNIDENDDIPF